MFTIMNVVVEFEGIVGFGKESLGAVNKLDRSNY